MTWVAYPITVLFTILATATQNTWPGWLLVLGRAPDVVLGAVVAVAIGGGPVLGCFAGLCAGLLVGSTQSAALGAFLLTYMLAGTLVGFMRGTLLADRVLVPMLVVLVAAPIGDLLRLLIAPPDQLSPWLLAMLTAALYSALVAAPVYLLVRLLTDRLYQEI